MTVGAGILIALMIIATGLIMLAVGWAGGRAEGTKDVMLSLQPLMVGLQRTLVSVSQALGRAEAALTRFEASLVKAGPREMARRRPDNRTPVTGARIPPPPPAPKRPRRPAPTTDELDLADILVEEG